MVESLKLSFQLREVLMITYFRCVWANKFTLAGYLILFFAALRIMLVKIGFDIDKNEAVLILLLFYIALSCLAVTAMGFRTRSAYLRSRNIIRNSRKGLSVKVSYDNGMYCDRVGYRLAVRDVIREKKSAAQ